MKQKLFGRLAAAAVLLLGAASASAHDFEVNGIYYNKNSDGTSVSVTFKGSSYDSYANEYSGAVTIPASVTYSGKTYSVTAIGNSAFYGCWRLESVEIPNSVKSISDYTFYECSGLTSVSIGNSVTEIGEYAFYGCSGLQKVEISDLEAWCKISFGNSSANPICYSHNLYLNGQEIKNLIIPETVQELKSYAFYGCWRLESVEIPNSVTSIDYQAFYNCSGLQKVEISDIEAWCKISFEEYANPIHYSNNLFLNGQEIKNLIIPETVQELKFAAFYGCRGLTSVEIPNSVTSIGDLAFYGCIGLTSVVIPNSVTSFGNAFSDCSGLTSVSIGNSVTSIGSHAFNGCIGLTSVEIPNSVTSIGGYAFAYCSGLTSVEIPNSVTSIGDNAFYDCSGLTSVTSLNIIPPTLGSRVFYDVPADCVLYVPEGCVGAYQSAVGWKRFGTILEIQPGGVEGISKAETAKVRGENGVIRVEGVDGARVKVFNTAGVCIYSGTDTEIYVPQRGLYVVKVAGRATKLAM